MTDTFLDTKADKQRIKHASFVSRITKPSSSSSDKNRDKNAKRHARHRQQRLAASGQAMVDGLADALPSLTADEVAAGDAERAGRVRHKSLRSRPGALRRRERVVRGEMERFGVSLAQLAGVQESTTAADTTAAPSQVHDVAMEGVQQQHGEKRQEEQEKSTSANRFAALRGFISATMEQNPAFAQRDAAVGGTKGV